MLTLGLFVLSAGQAADRSVSVTPIGDQATWITYGDYPASAVLAGISGTTAVRLDVNAEGRVVGCTVTTSSGNGELDTTACERLAERARFSPARDAQGRPIASVFAKRIRWSVPTQQSSDPSLVQRSYIGAEYLVRVHLTADRSIIACEVVLDSGERVERAMQERECADAALVFPQMANALRFPQERMWVEQRRIYTFALDNETRPRDGN